MNRYLSKLKFQLLSITFTRWNRIYQTNLAIYFTWLSIISAKNLPCPLEIWARAYSGRGSKSYRWFSNYKQNAFNNIDKNTLDIYINFCKICCWTFLPQPEWWAWIVCVYHNRNIYAAPVTQTNETLRMLTPTTIKKSFVNTL